VKIKKIGIIGFGSIAKKHVHAIYKIDKKIEIIKISKNKKKNYFVIRDAILLGLDGVIICSPADSHLSYIKILNKAKIPFIVEKPICRYDQIIALKKIIKNLKNNTTSMLGYQFRYDDILIKFKKILEENRIGIIDDVKIYCNSYLPKWRKKDYRKSVSVAKPKGGGVLHELSHEIDYMIWFFGLPRATFALFTLNKILTNKVEENVGAFFISKKNINIYMNLSFNSAYEKRYCLVSGSKGSLYLDLLKKRIKIKYLKTSKEKILFRSKGDNETNLLRQMNTFFKSIEQKKYINNLRNGLNVSKVIKFIYKSSKSKKVENIK
jgi:predicted dehydrogenase